MNFKGFIISSHSIDSLCYLREFPMFVTHVVSIGGKNDFVPRILYRNSSQVLI